MALTPKQQVQYNQLIAAGASQQAAMQAASLVPDSTPAPTGGNAVIPTQPQIPAAQSSTPSAPTATTAQIPQQQPQQTVQTQPQQQTQTTDTSAPASIPSQSLAPGSQGQDVSALQNTLVSLGYLTPQQVAGGQGVYGPQTTAAVAKLQQDLGVQAGGGAGYYGPQTQAALSQKYQSLFQSKQGSQAPDQAAVASQQIQSASAASQSTDPVFGAMATSIAPIMSALSQVLNNINNPVTQYQSLQDEYNQLSQKYNLPAMQIQMLNMQNVMNGTENDIRDELSKAGGGATESQVQAMAAARNKVIIKNYNALATNYNAAQTQVQNMMQYASADQSTQLQKEQMTASITESMASIEAQMMSMGNTMQKNATDNLNKIVTNVGYTGLAAQAQGNPQMLGYYEQSLGLAPGTLSDPKALAQMETYRQQQLQLGQQKVNISLYNAGLGGFPTQTNSNTPGLWVQNQSGQPGQSIVTTKTQGSDSQGRPYSVSQSQAQNLLNNGATIDPGTNNIVVPGVGYYIAQKNGSYALSIDPTSAEGQFIQYRNRAESPQPWQPSGSLSNQRMTRNSLTRQTNAALSQYVNSPLYKNVSSAATYFAKLYAGLNNPGSVGDPDIIDSLVKINTGGQGQITEQQYAAYAQGQTWGDKFQVVSGKVVAKGGTLSPDQRQEIKKLAQDTFSNYESEYETMYVQAMKNLDNQGIPDAFWGNMPDWSGLISGAQFTPLPEQSN